MSLTFQNHYSFTQGYDLWLTFMYYDPDNCAGGDHYRQAGWYRIPPGGQVTVWNGSTRRRYFPYYVECHADGATWSGDIQAWVSDSKYDKCHSDKCTPCRIVGFRQYYVGDFDDFIQPLTST
jgi:uncharacterized membrane protein